MWSNVVDLFREYMGTGLIIIWFLVSLIYLFIKEKRKHIRVLFIYVPVLILLVYFNPLFARLVYGVVGEEIYYRILWLLPISVVIAFAAVDIWVKLKGMSQLAFSLVAAVLIMISGSYIYSNPYFRPAENMYHVPQSVVDICDAIEVEGREVMAVFPEELIQYVRQYTPLVCMPYGREVSVMNWAQVSELHETMEAAEIEAEELVRLAREDLCAYIILSEDKVLHGNLEDYDFQIFDEMHGYVIYKDATVELSY